jgi:hypothetical protein
MGVVDDILGSLNAAKPSEEHRLAIRKVMLSSTFAFGKFVCGFHDLDADVHARMCRWIEKPTRFKLGLAPRGFLKTSTWTIADTLRYATNDPNSRTLLSNEIQDNAEKWVGLMQDVVMSPIYRWLFSDVVPDPLRVKWNAHQLELRRTAKWPEATIEACGVGGASTSNHYDRQKNDDLVGKAARESPLVMEKAIEHRKLSWSLMVNAAKSEIHDVGTRWSPNDVIDYVQKTVANVDRYEVKIRDKQGNPTWPTRYPEEIIEQIRLEQGPVLFALQYENRCVGEGVTELDPTLLRYYQLAKDHQGEQWLFLEKPNGQRKVKLSHCNLFQVIDAGLTRNSPDARTANVVAALTPPTPTEPFDIVLLEAKATHSDPNQVLEEAHQSYTTWQPTIAAIEVFGGHIAFYYWALKTYPEMRLGKLPTDTSANAKGTRIRGFWGAYLRQGRIFILRAMSDLLEEIVSWPNGKTVDLIDAGAYLPKIWIPPDPVDEQGNVVKRRDPDRDRTLRMGGMDDQAEAEAAEMTRSDWTGY